MKTTIKISLLLLIILFAFSCNMSYEYELRKSVFIEDEMNPGLPIYSEWGYNTFGAYIDRSKFISDENILPSKIIVNGDTLNITLNGYYQDILTNLKFRIVGYSPKDYAELLELNGVKINLKNDQVSVFLTQDSNTTQLQIIEGELYFKRVQLLLVDKEQTQSILSGTFELKTFKNDVPIAIANGRFDLGIGYDNFYNY